MTPEGQKAEAPSTSDEGLESIEYYIGDYHRRGDTSRTPIVVEVSPEVAAMLREDDSTHRYEEERWWEHNRLLLPKKGERDTDADVAGKTDWDQFPEKAAKGHQKSQGGNPTSKQESNYIHTTATVGLSRQWGKEQAERDVYLRKVVESWGDGDLPPDTLLDRFRRAEERYGRACDCCKDGACLRPEWYCCACDRHGSESALSTIPHKGKFLHRGHIDDCLVGDLCRQPKTERIDGEETPRVGPLVGRVEKSKNRGAKGAA